MQAVIRALRPVVFQFMVVFPTTVKPETAPHDETAPLFVYERAMPAMGDGRILMRCRQRTGPIAGMARSYTGEKNVFHANHLPPAGRQTIDRRAQLRFSG